MKRLPKSFSSEVRLTGRKNNKGRVGKLMWDKERDQTGEETGESKI